MVVYKYLLCFSEWVKCIILRPQFPTESVANIKYLAQGQRYTISVLKKSFSTIVITDTIRASVK